MARVYIGVLSKPHGLRGELKLVEGLGSSGSWKNIKEVFIGPSSDDSTCFQVRAVRDGGRYAIVDLEGVDEREKAEQLQGQLVYVDRKHLPDLEDGVFYTDDLLGLDIFDKQGRFLGTLDDIFDNGAHEVYVIGGRTKEILVPVIDGVVVNVNTQAGRVVVDLPEGLLEIFEDGA